MSPRSRCRRASFAASVVVLAACSGPPDAQARAVAPSSRASAQGSGDELITVDSVSVDAPLLLPSQLYVEQDAAIGVRAAGVLRTLTVDLGSPVSAGTVIGTVEDEIPRLAAARADVALDRARKVAWRAREMSKANGIPATELEDAEYQADLAEVTKREADQALERTRIVAPFDGVVTGRFVQPGRLLSVNDTVLRLTARGPWLARVRVPESEASAVRIGTRLTVRTASGTRLDGRVRRLAPAIDAASGTREAIVQVARDAAGSLLTGSTVHVEIAQRARRMVAIPQSAVSADGYVRVAESRRTVLRPVVTGAQFGDRVEIVSGLQPGERIRRRAQ